jgi:transcriptional regulator GlxA family with amidase domain
MLTLPPWGLGAQDGGVHSVVFVVVDQFQFLDLAGPADVIRMASHLGADPRYESLIATPGGQPVRAENGIQIVADTSLRALRDEGRTVDTLVVVGGVGSREASEDRALLDDLRAVASTAHRVTAVCTGAYLLGAAGLLDGYQATTHWAYCADFAAGHPGVDVLPDRIFVNDRNRWTSAGVTAGIDLFLAIVEADHGAEIAHAIAGWLVVFVRRPGGQAQFSAQLRAQPARTPGVEALQRWLPDHLQDDLSVDTLAGRAGMSPRSFARTFAAETGTTPAAYVEELRVEAARRLLESSDLTVETVAKAVGFRRPETLYRAFRRRVATTPDRYRQHFGLRHPTPSLT